MSAHDEAMGHGHDDDHGHDELAGAAHSTMSGYVTGFVLSVVLTAIPFWLVMGKVFDKSSTTALVLLGLGAVQIVVHMIYFLHMNARSENGWTLLALIFTLVLVVITLSGTLWVMFHLNTNMMPNMQNVQLPEGGTIVPPKSP
ncbi:MULTISPECIES: cytochrome o ubiquinol oxidase subunit IV [Cupriavidus]|uniref:Cytochrome bo(3) ubiquinol oxidase subunit 4 n=1 Tax=Cupriavidus pauculus TaxID=82633 RepID=A0A5P2HDV6_9BURK|nr:cytochrome o ubiquinol oxidase subunit IV [Cupriavidus pauculus]QET05535.1 cytochrome o ubiquinol oxidase subunit IV [Cupriavidus pauculus]